MNITLRKCLALTGTALLAASLPTGAVAKEENTAAVGSIRPHGKVKPADLPALAGISFAAAMKAALIAAPGKIIKAELEIEDGNLMYSFEIVGAGKATTQVQIDAGNHQL